MAFFCFPQKYGLKVHANLLLEHPISEGIGVQESELEVTKDVPLFANNQSTDSTGGSIVSECRLGNGPERELETDLFNLMFM